MTLADRIAEVLEAQPLPVCDLATTVRKRKAEVIATLNGNPDRFVLTGKARASRWRVRSAEELANGVSQCPSFTVDELAGRWGDDLSMGRMFVRDFLAAGYLESADGNGRVRVSELGALVSHRLNGARR